MMWCEFRMFTCVLTECCSLDVTLICQLIYKQSRVQVEICVQLDFVCQYNIPLRITP